MGRAPPLLAAFAADAVMGWWAIIGADWKRHESPKEDLLRLMMVCLWMQRRGSDQYWCWSGHRWRFEVEVDAGVSYLCKFH